MTPPSGLNRTTESMGTPGSAAGSVSSRSSFLLATSHSSTRPFPPAIASVRPSGLKSTPCHPPCDDRSGGATRRHVAVSQSVVPSSVTVASSLPSGLNAAPLTGASNPWSHARIREACSSAPRSAPRVSTEECRRSPSSASSRARSGCAPATSLDCAASRPGENQEDGHACEEHTEPPGAPTRLPQLAFLRGAARLEEGSFLGGEVDATTGPIECGREPRPAVQLPGIATDGLPPTGRLSEVAGDHQSFAILVQPPTQPRPLPDQSLMGDLRGALVEGEQSSLRQRVDEFCDRRGRRRSRRELAQGDASPRVLGSFPELRQTQEDAPRQVALVLRAPVVDLLGRPSDGRRHAARIAVAGQRERAPIPPRPGFHQRVGKEW